MTPPTTGPATATRRRFLTGSIAASLTTALATSCSTNEVAASAATTDHLTPVEEDSSAVEDHSTHVEDGPTVADIGFCTDMTAHHVQALVMCERVLGFDTGHAVQAAAAEVLRNQAIEVGMMRAWLADWGASTAPPERVMAWMNMTDMDMADMDTDAAMDMASGVPLADMPGYATNAQVLSLTQAEPGIPKGRIWLQLMRAHHVGGVAMANAATQLASADKVLRLAGTQSKVQAWEIEQYDILLATKYA